MTDYIAHIRKEGDPEGLLIPVEMLRDATLSLAAKGVFAGMVAGLPPAVDDPDYEGALAELVHAGWVYAS